MSNDREMDEISRNFYKHAGPANQIMVDRLADMVESRRGCTLPFGMKELVEQELKNRKEKKQKEQQEITEQVCAVLLPQIQAMVEAIIKNDRENK